MSANIEIIFATARELQAVDRPGYLDEACAGDEELRAKVEALLAADADAGSFLKTAHDPERDPDATLTMSRAYQDSKVPAEQAGEIIGRYKLLQQIGEGGFGTVWMAEQKVPVKRRIALKIIKLGMDTKQIIARFEAERQALAMMDHPNIAKVLDAGSTDAGRPYFVMELVRGIPILEYCDTEKLNTKSRLKLFILVCNAIQHAHQKGIIHRDIKPSNVLVTLHDGEPVPKVIDFGIAKATNQELTQKTLYTEFNQMVGTPAYMSPEQAEMSGLDIDTRSDIYSLGVLLYELLTGTTPFNHKELMDRGFAEMMRVIREETPHKPSTRLSSLGQTGTRTAEQRQIDLKKLGTVLRGDLDWIVMRCLEKNRTRRYDTATGLAADINRHLHDEPVEAGPPSAGYKMRKFVRRNKGVVIAGSAVAAALLIGFAGTAWGLGEAKDANNILADNIAVARDGLIEIVVDTVDLDPEERANIMDSMGISEDEALREQAAGFVEGYRIGFDGREEIYGETISAAERSDIGILVRVSSSVVRETVQLRNQLQTQADIARDGMDRISRIAYACDCPDDDAAIVGDAFYAGWLPSNEARYPDATEEELRLRGLTAFAANQASEMVKSRDAAEWSSYTANLALAQMAMDNGNWPEARARIAACPESKRGWEWEFLSNKAESVVVEFHGRGSLNPDKTRIFVSADNSARIYDLEGNIIGKPIRSTSEPYMQGEFSADSSRILVKFYDGGVRGFQVFTNDGTPIGKVIRPPLNRHSTYPEINLDGSMVVESSGNSARLWSASGDLVAELSHPDKVNRVRFSPDGKLIYTTCRDNKVRLWNLEGTQVGAAMPHVARVSSVAFSPDSNRLLTASGKIVQWWNFDGKPYGEPMLHDSGVAAISLDDSMKFVVTESEKSFGVWTYDGNRVSNIPRLQWVYRAGIIQTLFDWNSEEFVFSDHGSLRLVEFSGESEGISINPNARKTQFHYTANEGNQRVATWARNTIAQIWDRTGDKRAELRHNKTISEITFLSDQDFAAIRVSEGDFSALQVRPISLYSGDHYINGGRYDLGLFNNEVYFRVPAELDPYGVHQPSEAEPQTVAFAPDATSISTHPSGSRIVTAAADNTVRFWDTETEKQLAAIPMDAGVTNLTFTPDGTRLVIELDDGSARIFDTRSAEEQAADVQRRWAERVPAGVYLDTLMAGPTPTHELMAIIETDPSLTPLRRLAAAEVLTERLTDLTHQADRAFKAITKDQTDKATVLTAARAADLPVRVKEKVLTKAEAWEYSPPKLTEEEKRQRLAKAGFIVDRLTGTELPHLGNDRPVLVEAVEARIDLFGAEHPESMVASWVLGAMDFYEGRQEVGLQRMRATVKLYEQWSPPDFSDYLLISMYDNLIQAELITGHEDKAEEWLGNMIDALDKVIASGSDVGWHRLFNPGMDVTSSGFLPRVLELDYRRNFEVHKGENPGDETQKEYLARIATGLREVQRVGLRETALNQNVKRFALRSRTKNGKPSRAYYKWFVSGQPTVKIASDGHQYTTRTIHSSDGGYRESVVQAFSNDQRSQRPFALASYREGEYRTALDAITLAAKYRSAIPDDPATPMDESSPHPYDAAILAMSHFQLAQPLPESDPARAEHLAAARQALESCQSIMADPEALNDTGQPWAQDRIAQSLLTEAEALIGGEGDVQGDDDE